MCREPAQIPAARSAIPRLTEGPGRRDQCRSRLSFHADRARATVGDQVSRPKRCPMSAASMLSGRGLTARIDWRGCRDARRRSPTEFPSAASTRWNSGWRGAL